MKCTRLLFSRHAITRMFERDLATSDVRAVIETGEVIREYPDDKPFPSSLILGYKDAKPVHAVVAHDPADVTRYVITVYVPDPILWTPDFRLRNKS